MEDNPSNFIDKYKQENPQYKDVGDLEVADALFETYYSDKLSQTEFYAKVGVADQVGNEFTRGIKRGAANTAALVTEGVPAIAKGLVNEAAMNTALTLEPIFDPESNLRAYQEKSQKAQESFPTAVPSFKDVHNVQDAGSFVASAVGEQIPQLGTSILGGGIGGVVAKQGIKALAKKGGKELTEKQVEKTIQKGILAGTTAPSAAQNIPETYFNLLEQGEDEATKALLFGGLKVGLDAAAPFQVVKRILGKDASDLVAGSLLKRTATQAAGTATLEGTTEVAQESVDLIAEQLILDNPEFFSEENKTNLIDAGLKGFLGGGATSIATSPLQGAGDKGTFDVNKLSPKEKKTLEAQFLEEEAPINALDDTQINASYLDDETKSLAVSLGVNEESFNLISPKQIKEVDKAVSTSLNSTDLNTVFNVNEVPSSVLPELVERQKNIKEGERTDNLYVPGDGEIVVGSPVVQENTITNPNSKLEISNTRLLEEKVATPITFTLPTPLAKASPRYRSSSIAFESDVDRAIYIVGNKGTKSKSDNKYGAWLKDEVGLTDTEIQSNYLKIKQGLKKAEKNNSYNENDALVLGTVATKETTLPFNGNLRDDLLVPNVVKNNLKNTNLTDTAKTQRSTINLDKHVKRLIPAITVDKNQLTQNPIEGGLYLNVLDGALQESSLTKTDPSVYKDTYTSYEGKLNNVEALDSLTGDLVPYLAEGDYTTFLSSPEGRKQVRAEAFSKWMEDGGKRDKNLPPMFNNAFNKQKLTMDKLGRSLRGLGFNTLDDVYNNGTETLGEVNYNTQLANAQRISEQAQTEYNTQRKTLENYDKTVEGARATSNRKGKLGNPMDFITMGGYTRVYRSLADFASQDPLMGQLYDAVTRRLKHSHALLTSYMEELGDFMNQKPAVRHKLHELANYLRDTDQRARLDEEGRLLYERDGKVVRLADTEISQQYMNMQKAYRKVLDDREKEFKAIAYRGLKDVLVNPNYNLTQVLTAMEVVTDQKVRDQLQNLANFLTDVNNMRKKDFVPHMRFGDYGITVKDRETKEQVAFYTMERGKHKDKYNQLQYEEAHKELNKLYSDSSKYDIQGKDKPFLLTYNELKNNIDSRFINLELLSSLLHSKGIDEESHNSLRDEVYKDILEKGFKKRFSPAKNIEGYSKDWDRVQNAYLTGAAHYLSSIQAQPEFGILSDEIDKVDDLNKRKVMRKYIDYVNSAEDDKAGLRTFNFLWTMGANISTAALQIMTLPTTTLGAMTQYNPNPVMNAYYISKWFKIGMTQFMKHGINNVYTDEGGVSFNFSSKENLDQMVKDGVVTQPAATQIRQLYVDGTVKEGMVEESTRQHQFESRDGLGKARQSMTHLARLAGLPISSMEQLTRFATSMATFDMLESNPKALARAKKVLANDYRFQAQVANDSSKTMTQHLSAFTTDEAHAVFGKAGRPEFMRGYGGALFFPFMTYPQQALEFMVRMYGRGPEGKQAVLTTLGSLFVLSGLMGLPGGELLKELYEEIEKQITGSEEDLDALIREKIHSATGSVRFAKFITQGGFRAYLGMDVSKRIGLPIAGQDQFMTVSGMKGDASDLFGVSGSMMGSMANAWNEYSNDSSAVSIASSMLPVAASNLLKASNFASEGAKTRKGTQLVAPEDITTSTKMMRVLGITSDQIASQREKQWYTQIAEKKHQVGVERHRNKAKKIATEMVRLQQSGETTKAKALQRDLENVIMEYTEYAKENGFDPSLKYFNRSVKEAVQQRINPSLNIKDVRKNARQDALKILDFLGVE